MAYEVTWSPKSRDHLRKLEKSIVARVIAKVEDLRLAPYHFIEKMIDVDCWKLRVGDYRVILDVNEQKREILVLKVGHRKNVYK